MSCILGFSTRWYLQKIVGFVKLNLRWGLLGARIRVWKHLFSFDCTNLTHLVHLTIFLLIQKKDLRDSTMKF